MRIKSIFILFLLINLNALTLFAQKQNNQWRFGNVGAIDFNTVPPSFVTGAALSTFEGSASVANRVTGALLFYTDGVTVWNANNQVMPNGTGLLGGTSSLLSSTTAAVIIPKPGVSYEYYLVTVDEQSSNNGIRYSVVDMNLNGGLGDIIPGFKNIPIYQTTSEKLEVVPASDQQSYWLISHDLPGNSFLAFRVTDFGIETTPVISSLGGVQGNGAGHMKINKQFNKIAIGLLNLGAGSSTQIELYDFNNTTGVISNPTIWNYNFPVALIYGVEFSPNGKVLYVSDLQNLIQYDITQPTPLAIENSAYQVSTSNSTSLQLGIDDKIYVNAGSINAINCPNKLGAACGYQTNVIANQTGGGGYGLPKWVYYANDTLASSSNNIIYSDSCFGNATQFSIQNTAGISSITWNFGDPNSGANNTAVGFTANHTFSQVGTYNIRAFLSNACGTDTLYFMSLSIVDCNIITPTITGIKLIGDTCILPSSITLQAEGISSSPYFFWNFGDPASGVNDTITITGLSPSPFPIHTFSSAGVYTICVSFQEPGFPISTVCRTISIGLCCNGIITSNDTCIQNNIPFSIISPATISSVNWNFNDPSSGTNNTSTSLTPTHLFSATGTYNVTANGIAACGSFQISYPLQIVNCATNCTGTINSYDTCQLRGTLFQVVSNNTINSIIWNFDDPSSGANNTSTSLTPTHLFSTAGTYIISSIVNFACGADTIYKTISIINCDSIVGPCQFFIPTAFTPNGDGINDNFRPKANCKTEKYELMIYNRWGQVVFNTRNQYNFWDGKLMNKDASAGSYIYMLKYKFPSQDFKKANGSILLIR